MRETIEDYPALRLEDDGFLMSLKIDFVEINNELFGISDDLSFAECLEKLVKDNKEYTDKGSSLPLYLPVYSDDGTMVGSRAVPVWAGVHIDFPLYPGIAKDSVESFLYGNIRYPSGLGDEFLACDSAFKLALLVHYSLDNIIIHKLAIESFLLGRYEEMPFKDDHYLATGLPTTSLVEVRSSTGLSCKRSKTANGELCISIGDARTDGWIVRVRGTKPKETVLRDCWQEIRRKNARANTPIFTIDGNEYGPAKVGEDGRVRKRAGSAYVDYMVAWIDSLAATEGLPLRGTRIDWKEIHRQFEKSNPDYINYWTADTMRRTYKRRQNC